MTTVETRVVNPVNRAAVDAVTVTESDLVDVAMKREEDQMLVDEEISSSEGLDLESQMLTVALVKSVVDATPAGENNDSPSSRYGLRKRRRPCDSPSDEHDHGVDAPQPLPSQDSEIPPGIKESVVVKEDPKLELEKIQPQKTPISQQLPIPPTYKPIANSTELPRHVPLTIKEEPGATKGIKIEDHPILGKLKANVVAPGVVSRPLIPPAKAVPAALKKKPAALKRKIKRPAKAKGPPVKQGLFPTSGAVPNPLSQVNVTPSAIRSYAPRPTGPPRARPVSTSVPCPLPSSVPCPLKPDVAAASVEKKRVTISEPPAPPSRPRVFSVDLDPSTFDFSDIAGDHNVHERSDAVDMPAAESSEFPIFQRDRAFSFDFFNFMGDELLPGGNASSHLNHPGTPSVLDEAAPLPRPRGDSIIFDPASFQDGGIHEKTALLRARGSDPAQAVQPVVANSSDIRRQGAPTTPNPLPPYNGVPTDPSVSSGQIATLPSSLNDNSPSNVNSSPATFQMELLNKDGRIGIYLPEARKARIARFHAKRKMRIWRKRIKYDCRKKLADSRPRIKGRFVKRSDMDGEE